MSEITPGRTASTASLLPTPRATVSPGEPAEPVDGRSARWADHREARRAELVRVARKVVHNLGPDVSMDEIAAAAGTSKSIVYRYFSDKTGLQIAVAEAVVLQIQGALEGALHASPTPRGGLRAMVSVYLEMIESSPNVYFFVTREGSLESGSPLGHLLDAVTNLVAAPFARALADAGAMDDAESRVLAQTWAAGAVGFVRGAGESWLRRQGDPQALDRPALTAQVAAWLWAGPVGVLTPNLTDPVVPAWAVQPVPPDPHLLEPR